jgi:hypothetical protein
VKPPPSTKPPTDSKKKNDKSSSGGGTTAEPVIERRSTRGIKKSYKVQYKLGDETSSDDDDDDDDDDDEGSDGSSVAAASKTNHSVGLARLGSKNGKKGMIEMHEPGDTEFKVDEQSMMEDEDDSSRTTSGKRGRGRPRGSTTKNHNTAAGAATRGGGGRGAPRGGTARKVTSPRKLDQEEDNEVAPRVEPQLQAGGVYQPQMNQTHSLVPLPQPHQHQDLMPELPIPPPVASTSSSELKPPTITSNSNNKSKGGGGKKRARRDSNEIPNLQPTPEGAVVEGDNDEEMDDEEEYDDEEDEEEDGEDLDEDGSKKSNSKPKTKSSRGGWGGASGTRPDTFLTKLWK